MKSSDFTDNDIQLLISGYLTGSITEDDLVKLTDWINNTHENRTHFNEIKDSWILAGRKKCDLTMNNDESWEIVRNKLNIKRSGLSLVSEGSSREKADFKKYLKLAASWLFIFGLGSALTWWITGKPEEKKNVAESRTVEISAPLGSRSIVIMPDSTQIWLNAGTTITYNHDYGNEIRTLNLSGEAYFKVAKDSLHPFVVNTNGILVRALGTSFNVKAYPEEKTISATLEEGKIIVQILGKDNKSAGIMLKPKDKLIFHRETHTTEKYVESAEEKIKPEKNMPASMKDVSLLSGVRTELYTSWKDPRWVIDGEPLSTLAPMLERRFNLKVLFENEQLRKYKFTGTIENETVDQILNALKMTAPLDYQIHKDTLRLILNLKSREEFKKVMTINN